MSKSSTDVIVRENISKPGHEKLYFFWKSFEQCEQGRLKHYVDKIMSELEKNWGIIHEEAIIKHIESTIEDDNFTIDPMIPFLLGDKQKPRVKDILDFHENEVIRSTDKWRKAKENAFIDLCVILGDQGRAERCVKFFRNKAFPILECLKDNKNGTEIVPNIMTNVVSRFHTYDRNLLSEGGLLTTFVHYIIEHIGDSSLTSKVSGLWWMGYHWDAICLGTILLPGNPLVSVWKKRMDSMFKDNIWINIARHVLSLYNEKETEFAKSYKSFSPITEYRLLKLNNVAQMRQKVPEGSERMQELFSLLVTPMQLLQKKQIDVPLTINPEVKCNKPLEPTPTRNEERVDISASPKGDEDTKKKLILGKSVAGKEDGEKNEQTAFGDGSNIENLEENYDVKEYISSYRMHGDETDSKKADNDCNREKVSCEDKSQQSNLRREQLEYKTTLGSTEQQSPFSAVSTDNFSQKQCTPAGESVFSKWFPKSGNSRRILDPPAPKHNEYKWKHLNTGYKVGGYEAYDGSSPSLSEQDDVSETNSAPYNNPINILFGHRGRQSRQPHGGHRTTWYPSGNNRNTGGDGNNPDNTSYGAGGDWYNFSNPGGRANHGAGRGGTDRPYRPRGSRH